MATACYGKWFCNRFQISLKKPDTESTSHKGCERSAGRVAPTNTQGRFKRDASRNAWSITGWWFLKVFKCFSMIAEATANTSEFEHIYKLWISMNCFVLRSLAKSFKSCFCFASSDDHWMIPRRSQAMSQWEASNRNGHRVGTVARLIVAPTTRLWLQYDSDDWWWLYFKNYDNDHGWS